MNIILWKIRTFYSECIHIYMYMCVCTRIMYLSMRYVFIFFSLFLTRKQNFDGILVSINNAIYIVIHIHITEKYIQLLIIIKIEDEKETWLKLEKFDWFASEFSFYFRDFLFSLKAKCLSPNIWWHHKRKIFCSLFSYISELIHIYIYIYRYNSTRSIFSIVKLFKKLLFLKEIFCMCLVSVLHYAFRIFQRISFSFL